MDRDDLENRISLLEEAMETKVSTWQLWTTLAGLVVGAVIGFKWF